MKPKRKPQRLDGGCCFFLVVATLVSSCGLLFVLFFGNPQLICFGTLLPSASNFEEFAQVQIPDSATNVSYKIKDTGALAAPNCTMWLKFEMDSSDFQKFQLSTQIDNFETTFPENNRLDVYMRRENWSQPDNVLAGFAQIECCSPEINQWIFIDTGNSDTWTVYIITNEYWLD